MDDQLRRDINHYFYVFKDNVERDCLSLQSAPGAADFLVKFKDELDDFHNAVISRLA